MWVFGVRALDALIHLQGLARVWEGGAYRRKDLVGADSEMRQPPHAAPAGFWKSLCKPGTRNPESPDRALAPGCQSKEEVALGSERKSHLGLYRMEELPGLS